MYFLIFMILQVLFSIYFFIKSIKTKDNKNWLILFSLNIAFFISVVLIGNYSITKDWNFFKYLVLVCFIGLFVYIPLLFLEAIFKIIDTRKNKKQKNIVTKLEKKAKIKAIIIPLIFVVLSTVFICGIDYSKYIFQKRGEINTYNNVRIKEINKMANFLNKKYNINIQENDCIYYREQDYTRHSDILGNGTTYNIPFIAVFEIDNEQITVADRKGFISDNKQLKELNDMIINYYYKKTGIKFDYVEFGKSYIGSWSGKDNIINTVLQTKFNTLITDQNIEQFINYILQEPDLCIKFYIKENDKNNLEKQIDNITQKLEYLRNYALVEVYGYDGHLTVKHKEIEFPKEHKNYGNLSEDYDDGYKYFGCYYIDEASSDFTFSLRSYSTIGESINGWKYRVINE